MARAPSSRAVGHVGRPFVCHPKFGKEIEDVAGIGQPRARYSRARRLRNRRRTARRRRSGMVADAEFITPVRNRRPVRSPRAHRHTGLGRSPAGVSNSKSTSHTSLNGRLAVSIARAPSSRSNNSFRCSETAIVAASPRTSACHTRRELSAPAHAPASGANVLDGRQFELPPAHSAPRRRLSTG